MSLISTSKSWNNAKRYGFDTGRKLYDSCFTADLNDGQWSNFYTLWGNAFPLLVGTGATGCTTPNSILGTAPSSTTNCEDGDHLITMINRARTNPLDYARYIKDHFCNNQFGMPQADAARTINFLVWQHQHNTLTDLPKKACFSAASNVCAMQNVADFGSTSCSTISHNAGETTAKARIQAVATRPQGPCYYAANSGENIARISSPHPCAHYVSLWLIDRGISNRGHRKSVLNAKATGIGAAVMSCGTSVITVANLAVGYDCA